MLFFTILLNLLTVPLLNSGDDTYCLYTLAGGYGEAPTHLVQYKKLWNPVLGRVVSSLFGMAPGVNWYTVLLLLLHFAGCSFILYTLIRRLGLASAFFFFLGFFIFIEARQLLSLTLTGTAITASMGGLCLLLHQFAQQKIKSTGSVSAFLLLVLAGMLREQVAWLQIALFGSIAIVLLPGREWWRYVMTMLLAVVLLWGFFKIQVMENKKKVPGWTQQEQFRQALFHAYNRQLVNVPPPGTFADSTEQQLFYAGFLYDTSRFNNEHLKAIGEKITRSRSLLNPQDRYGLYWFFVEMRVYLLLFAITIILLLSAGLSGALQKWCLPLSAYLGVHVILFLWMKITMPLHLGLLGFLWIALAMLIRSGPLSLNRRKQWLGLVLFAVASGWMLVRLYKENEENKERRATFLCAMAQLKQHPDRLFVATDDTFPINYFYIWDTPANYPASNLVYKDRLITFTHYKTLQRYGIADLTKALGTNPNIVFVGKALPALEALAAPARLSAPLTGFGCLEVRQLK